MSKANTAPPASKAAAFRASRRLQWDALHAPSSTSLVELTVKVTCPYRVTGGRVTRKSERAREPSATVCAALEGELPIPVSGARGWR
jgi:hypothetical protein